MARVLITTFGSFGDLFPYLAIATELKMRGHHVTIATSAAHGPKVEAEGIAFHAVRPDIELDNRKLVTYVMDARRGSERVVRHMSGVVRESYEDTVEAARHADAIVTHPITYASVIAAQKLKLPWISTVLAPLSFLSAYDPPVAPQAPWLHGIRVLGPGFMRWFWNLGLRQILPWAKPILELRKELGLLPGEHPIFNGSHSSSLVLALFSRRLAAPQPDWPRNTVITGFPFYDRGELAPSVRRFLEEGPPPIVFTLGSSAVSAAGSFYVQSLEAVKRLGSRAIFLTGPHPQGLPGDLPPEIKAVDYAPHGAIFPHASAIVHQGGIGTTAQAMRSARPALVVPFAHDQFDNAARVARLGAAVKIYRSHYNPRRVAALLRRLSLRPRYANAAEELGRQVRAENGARTAADAIEAMISRA